MATFPASPQDGDNFVFNGKTYYYNFGRWMLGFATSIQGIASNNDVVCSPVAPPPVERLVWIEITTSDVYQYQTDTWVLLGNANT